MGHMKRAEAQFRQEHASIRPVMMEFKYDSTVKLWRVVFRPRGDSIPLPRVMHFGEAEKLRDLFRRLGRANLQRIMLPWSSPSTRNAALSS
jgi:hypothetical protein